MTIHTDDPFATPEPERSAARQLRGRFVSPVTLWTSGTAPGGAIDPASGPVVRPAGLTVASVVVADGDPAHVLGLIDPESELWTAIETSRTAVVTVLTDADRNLADVFGFVAPAPGGPFATAPWLATDWGPVLAESRSWAGARLVDAREVGFSLLVDVAIERIELSPDTAVSLLLRRGRYVAAPTPGVDTASKRPQ